MRIRSGDQVDITLVPVRPEPGEVELNEARNCVDSVFWTPGSICLA